MTWHLHPIPLHLNEEPCVSAFIVEVCRQRRRMRRMLAIGLAWSYSSLPFLGSKTGFLHDWVDSV